MEWLSGQWEGPVRISTAIEEKWWERCERDRPGVYRLFALRDGSTFDPMPLCRVCGTDETGTIYIGASGNVAFRLGDLLKEHSDQYQSNSHIPLSARLAEKFGPAQLAFCWQFTDDPWRRENEIVSAYEAVFGEPPPNNSQRPRWAG